MWHHIIVLALLFIAISLTSPAGAQTPSPGDEGRDPAVEQQIHQRLQVIDASAVPIFKQATAELDNRNYSAAERDYMAVLELAPDFPDALRRLSYIAHELGRDTDAVAYAERAYNADATPHNALALAQALAWTDDAQRSADAIALAQEAVDRLPDDVDAYKVLLAVAIVYEDETSLRQASTRLVQIAPDFAPAHYIVGLFLGEDGNWPEAEHQLLLSQELGIPAEMVESALEDTGIRGRARFQRLLGGAVAGIAIWVSILVLLFVTGTHLSHKTIDAVNTAPSKPSEAIQPLERKIRRLYRSSSHLHLPISISLFQS